MSQYLDLGKRIVDDGVWIENDRTGKRCLTIINADMQYEVAKCEFPLDTTRKSFYKSAIAELLGYIRGYDSAAEFRKLGTKTWDANANLNKDWLRNPNRKGVDDMGFVYGKVGRNFPKPDGGSVDLLRDIVEKISAGKDDRGLIYTFYHPGAFHLGCLRPCLYSHHFSLLGDILFLNSIQRSVDYCLGLNFNSVQVYVFLAIMAQITGKRPGVAYHKLINVHIYEDQLELFKNVHMNRDPFPSPKLKINPDIKTLEDLESWVTVDDFEVVGYQHHDAIKYPFSV